MARKVSYEADSPKKGMSLKELLDNVNEAVGLAKINEKPLEDSKVTVFVNFGGGVKQLIVEV